MSRLTYLDLAKGFTILFIPAIHSVMIYSSPEVYNSALAIFLAFIAEWPGAQLLMFIMGITFSFSKFSIAYSFKKSIALFIAGILLNTFKFLVPISLGILPPSLFVDLSFHHPQQSSYLNFLFIGDILQFAAFAILTLALVKNFPFNSALAILLAYSVILSAPLFWDLHHPNMIIDYLLHLVGSQPDDTFFPLFPWLAYPLIGFAIGNYIRLPYASMPAIFFSGCFAFIAALFMKISGTDFPDTSFWRTYPDMTIMHLGFVMMWIPAWYYLSRARFINFNQSIFRTLVFCSRHITIVYALQWILIFWLIPLFGYQNLNLIQSIFAIIIIYIILFTILRILKLHKPTLHQKDNSIKQLEFYAGSNTHSKSNRSLACYPEPVKAFSADPQKETPSQTNDLN